MFESLHDKAMSVIYTMKQFSIDFFEFMSDPIEIADVVIFDSGFELLGMTALTVLLIRVIKSVLPDIPIG